MKSSASFISFGSARIHKAWVMLLACSFLSTGYLAMIFAAGGNFYVPVCSDLGIARSQISLWQTVHFVASAIAMPIYGKLYEKLPFRPMLTVAAFSCVLAAFLMSTYTQWWMWMISGFLYGSVGAGLMYLPTAVILGNWFHRKRGFALGIALSFSSLAGAVISPVFAAIISSVGWRAAYVVQAILIALFTIPFTMFVVVKDPYEIGAVPYGWVEGEKSDAELEAQRERAMSLQGGVPFKKALTSVAFLMLFIFAGVSALIGSGFDAHIPGYAVSIGYDPMFGSLLVSALFAGSCCEKLVMGWVNDKIGVEKAVFIEFALVVAGMLGFIFLRNQVALLAAAFIFGVQDSFLSLSLPLLTRAFFGGKNFTQLYAWASIGSGLLGSFGSPLIGLSYDIAESYLPAFCGGCVICVVGFAAIVIGKSSARRLREAYRTGSVDA